MTRILENNAIKNTYEFGAINRLTKATNALGHIANDVSVTTLKYTVGVNMKGGK